MMTLFDQEYAVECYRVEKKKENFVKYCRSNNILYKKDCFLRDG